VGEEFVRIFEINRLPVLKCVVENAVVVILGARDSLACECQLWRFVLIVYVQQAMLCRSMPRREVDAFRPPSV
jgi:hypothetical protein